MPPCARMLSAEPVALFCTDAPAKLNFPIVLADIVPPLLKNWSCPTEMLPPVELKVTLAVGLPTTRTLFGTLKFGSWSVPPLLVMLPTTETADAADEPGVDTVREPVKMLSPANGDVAKPFVPDVTNAPREEDTVPLTATVLPLRDTEPPDPATPELLTAGAPAGTKGGEPCGGGARAVASKSAIAKAAC